MLIWGRIVMKLPLPAVFLLLSVFLGCSSLKKDNKPQPTLDISASVKDQIGVYRPLIKAQADSYGLIRMGGSIGDSALFSCLARAAGALDFDPAVLFKDGKPLRHPDIKPDASGGGSPISHDMVNGILWCLYDMHKRGDTDHAINLTKSMIDFGRAHKKTVGIDVGWMFCTDQDVADYHISGEDVLGRCFMSPGIVKDIYRIAKMIGMPCDADCQYFMAIGPNIPSDETGFKRHLAVIGTVRNGLVEGGINDNSLKIVLQKAHEAQPRNALYQAAYHLYNDGVQDDAYRALTDESLFPRDHLPTSANYATDYLFQRDDDTAKGPGADWLPDLSGSSESNGRGVDFVFAAAMALGEIR